MISDFFKIHPERRIGYKEITAAELGLKKSHETHIGLANDTLKFLPNTNVVKNTIFIYKEKFEFLDAFFDRIATPNGSYRSLKLRMGGRDEVSLLRVIRSITDSDRNTSWFLLWFGLENQQTVFLLCSKDDMVYKDLVAAGLEFRSHAKRIDSSNDIFESILSLVISRFNQNAEESIIDAVNDYYQPNNLMESPLKKFIKFDRVRAERVIMEIGRLGETFVDYHLASQLANNYISHYVWENRNFESGKPYDFRIEDCSGNSIYLDVKSTRSEFERKILFSSQEIEFVAKWIPTNHHRYQIYRIFNMEEKTADLRICHNPNRVLSDIHSMVSRIFAENQFAYPEVSIEGVKIGILPTIEELVFDRAKTLIVE